MNTTESESEVGSDALLEDVRLYDYQFTAKPIPVDSYYSKNCYDSIPVLITAVSREDAERQALLALGEEPKTRLKCKWKLKLLRVNSSSNS